MSTEQINSCAQDLTEVKIQDMNGCGKKNGAYYSFRVEQAYFFPPMDKITATHMGDVMRGEKEVSTTEM